MKLPSQCSIFMFLVSSIILASPAGCYLFGKLSTWHILYKSSWPMLLCLTPSSLVSTEIGVIWTDMRNVVCPSWEKPISSQHSNSRPWVIWHPEDIWQRLGWAGSSLHSSEYIEHISLLGSNGGFYIHPYTITSDPPEIQIWALPPQKPARLPQRLWPERPPWVGARRCLYF